MSFAPVVTLTKVPRDNSSYTLTDATPTGGASGYGSTNAPANAAAITSLFGMVQPYGELPANATGVIGAVGDVAGFTFSVPLLDGLNSFYALYGLSKTLTDWTSSPDGTKIISNDPALAAKMDGVNYISLDGNNFPIPIVSVVGTVITLSGSVTPGLTGTTLYIYYSTYIQAMTLNNGEALCVNGISLMPIEADACDNGMKIFHNIALKLAAEIAFNCGNLSKAHEAARLLSGSVPGVTQNCETCV